jgi:hypothetical protein
VNIPAPRRGYLYNGKPISEPGEFAVMVGGSSRAEDLLVARFTQLSR